MSTIVIIDNGLNTGVAQFLARDYDVKYHKLTADPYPASPQSTIGQGLPGVKWIADFWKHIDTADAIFFPDVYEMGLQLHLLEKGYPVCGCLGSARMETSKVFFKKQCEQAGLFVPYTYLCEGLDELWEYMKDHSEWNNKKYLKNAEKYRGDWDTIQFKNNYMLKGIINKMRSDLGEERANKIEILVEDEVKSSAEIGVDTPAMLNGVIAENSALGYERKDEAIVEKVFREMPPIIHGVSILLTESYKQYQGPYSLEIRIKEDGTPVPIDATCRCGSPPTGVLLPMYGKAYGKAIIKLANGEMPTLEEDYIYGAEIILSSAWHRNNELHVGVGKKAEPFLHLKNHVRREGQYYCIPNHNDGIFGSICGVGKTLDDATGMALELAEELNVHQLDFQKDCFEDIQECIDNGKAYGINF